MKTNNKKLSRTIASIVLAVICVFYVYPIFTILINSLKMNKAITTTGVFQLPSADNFVGLANYVEGITSMNFLKSFWYSLVISVMSVVLIMLCCSMAAWYIIRVNWPLSKAITCASSAWSCPSRWSCSPWPIRRTVCT